MIPFVHEEPHHFDVYARLHTDLDWLTGVALPSLLPPDF
jgi:hypothetical protein